MDNFEPVPIKLKNNYILIQDIKNETITKSGIYIPDDTYNRFSRVIAVSDDDMSGLKPGDLIIKPIGKESKIKLNGHVYGCIRSNLIFAKIIDDGE